MHPRLAIAYGAVSTRAVLAWSDGRWIPLAFDGGSALSSAVHVSRAEVSAGAQAWRQATTQPDGLVVSPLRAGIGEVTVGGRLVAVADLVAATLREVVGEATRLAGGPVEDVCLVVPAGWGPRRRTWLRHATREAGLPAAWLLEVPVAAASCLPPGEGSDRPVLVIDVGGGCEATVVQPGPAGFEVLATLADDQAGGDRIDADLVALLTGGGLADLPAGQRWTVLTDVQTTKHALSEQVAVTMPMPGGNPPMVVNTAQVSLAAQPVFERIGQLAADAVSNADLTVGQLRTVCLIGGAAATPGASQMITATLGVPVQPAAQPELAAVRAAAGAGSNGLSEPMAGGPRRRRPSWRRLVTLALPGLFSLTLYAQFVFGADFEGDSFSRAPGHFYVVASWGELAMASVLAVILCLQAESLFTVVFDDRPATAGREWVDGGGRIVSGLGLAAAAGAAAASMYAVVAAVYFSYPSTEALRWALLPSLPTSVCAVILAGLAWRGHRPAGGWDTLLAFPPSSLITAATGAVGVALYNVAELENSWIDPAGYLGGVLLGIGVACALTRHTLGRIALALPFGFFLSILSRAGLGIPAVIYAIAVALWCAQRAWILARTNPAGRPVSAG